MKILINISILFFIIMPESTAQLTFTEVSGSAGAGLSDGTTRGIAWADFNNDGYLDLFVPTAGTSANKFYMNNGDGTFTDIASAVGLNDQANTITCSWADYDNDGDLDLVTTATGNPTRLWRNNRNTGTDTSFTSVENSAGINSSGAQMATWADFNKDGLIDFYSPVSNSNSSPDVLYKNNGDGTFTNVSASAGVNNQVSGFSEQAIHWGDFNKDGYPELFVGNLLTTGVSVFYINNGDETFTSSAAAYGFDLSGRGSQWIDYDNDNDWDFCFASYAGGTAPVPVKLFRNNGDNTFTEIGSTIGLSDNLVSWGVTCGDVDNNGYEDIFVTVSGSGTNCQLYLNNGDGTYSNETASAGLASLIQLMAAFGDYNNDGFLDLYTSGSSTNGNKLFLNDGVPGKHWLQINLSGTISNKSGLGSQITVVAGSLRMMREINTGIGYRSQNQLRAHFGLDVNTQADSVIVRWQSGIVDILTNVSADQIITIEEGETIPVELVSFTAHSDKNNVLLKWITASEVNNKGFEVERKSLTQKGDWEKITFIEGYGTTTEVNTYSYLDKYISEGGYQYRLKQLDFNGMFEYSAIVETEINIPFEFYLAQNFPNPFNPVTRIKYSVPFSDTKNADQLIILKLYDVLGNEIATLINEVKAPGVYEYEFRSNDLSSGVYYYSLSAGKFFDTKKMLLLR